MRQRDQLTYLQALGIPVWVPKHYSAPPTDEIPAPKPALAEQGNAAVSDWRELRQMTQACTACELHMERIQAVLGTGSRSARLMVIGEAPGEEEDRQGEPFVGRSGRLLDQMLLAIKQPRASVYITNIVKCRPPNNRNPHQEEALSCARYLHRQIALVLPRAILAVGKVAAQNLLQTGLPVGKMRGRQYHYAPLKIPIIVTYHPAYLLRSPKEKSKAWQDLKALRSLLS